jgi:hypothetical protein
MRTAPSSENLLLGKGQLFFDRFDINGVGTGLKHMGNVTTFELSTSDDNVDKYSSMIAGAPLYKRVNRRRTQTLRIIGDEFHPENFALAAMGDVATLAQAATAVVGEPISAVTVPGMYHMTAKLGPVSAVVVHFGAGAGVLGVDYAVVDPIGLIRILPGTILTGAVTVDYTPTAYTTTNGPAVLSAGTAGVIAGRLVFLGDPTTGPRMKVEVHHVNITPDGAVGLISDDYAQMTLSAAALDDSINNPDAPIARITYLD